MITCITYISIGETGELVYRKESFLKRIEKLREYRHDLKQMSGISFEEYIKDRKIKYSIERLLFLISENILDFFDHILSSQFEIISESYEDIIDNAYKKDLINASLYSNLKGLGGFRNILAHEYLDISDEEVFRNFRKTLGMIDNLIEAFENIIKEF
ncbi:MAG: type VII toxin-antitoxin system HepT family RNase toxin [Thermodesulfovibrionales bacterium]